MCSLWPFSAATVNTEIEEEHESFLDVCPHFISGFEKEWHNITAVSLPVCESELDTYRNLI